MEDLPGFYDDCVSCEGCDPGCPDYDAKTDTNPIDAAQRGMEEGVIRVGKKLGLKVVIGR